MMKAVIITADDFGFSQAVNEAIEQAHLRGVLGTASLMPGARAAGDAIERARRLPALRVGLHLVLAGLSPVSPPSEIPDLVGADGKLSSRLFLAGLGYYFRPSVRRQLEREVRAQFELFLRSGLTLDHVNCHKHLHLHPTVFDIIIKAGAGHGMKAVRLPYEPYFSPCREPRPGRISRVSRISHIRGLASWLFLLPWTALLRRKIRNAGMNSNDFVFGLRDSGRMELDRVLKLLRRLPAGVTEMYFHPAARPCPELEKEAPGSRHVSEFAALIDPAFARAIAEHKIRQVGFGDLPLA